MIFNILCHALACLFFVTFALAQAPPPVGLFQWNFANQFLSTSLPTCLQLPIGIIVNTSKEIKPQPPYYMLAFEVGGVPQRQLLGNDATSLNWTVTHKPGTKLWLDVVDSQGASGGVGPNVFTVTSGQLTACLPPNPPQDFTLSSNITSGSSLNTCQPWGLRIKGGSPPYNLTIMETSSAVVTNVSLFGTEDAFTYINRGDTGRTLLAAVSDITGRWALGTPQINVVGSTDTSCPGLVSSSGDSAELDKEDAARVAALAAAAKKKQSTIIGVVVTLVLLLLLGSGVGVFFWLRRRAQYRIDSATTKAEPYTGTPPSVEAQTSDRGGQVLSINAFLDSREPPSARPTLSVSTTRSPVATSPNPFSSPHDSYVAQSTVGGSVVGSSVSRASSNIRPTSSSTASSNGRNGFTSFPSQSIRRSAKSIEAGFSLEDPPMPSSSMLVRNASAAPSSVSVITAPTSGSVGEIVYQHQDGGTIVRELPPPYMARGSGGTQPDSDVASPEGPEPDAA